MGRVQVETALLFETPTEICARVFRTLKPRTSLPEIRVEFCRFAGANSFVRLENSSLCLRITDLLSGAPAPVLEALFHILLCKLFRRKVSRAYSHRYRLYLNRRDVRRAIHLIRQIRGRKQLTGPKGEHYDLEKVFEALNIRFFNGLMGRPALGWSRRPSRTALGHYDPSHNAIILSRILDSPAVPALVVDYVMYHEMLHLKFPVEHDGARCRFHPAEFRKAERQFPNLPEAKRGIKNLK